MSSYEYIAENSRATTVKNKNSAPIDFFPRILFINGNIIDSTAIIVLPIQLATICHVGNQLQNIF